MSYNFFHIKFKVEHPCVELGILNSVLCIYNVVMSGCTVGSPSKQLVAELPLTFTKDEDMESAFSRLARGIIRAIASCNYSDLQIAAIDKAKSQRLPKSHELLPLIVEADSFKKLCIMLMKSSYWNFLDTRMMEAMVTASMIPAAQESMENFKNTYFNMTLEKVAPYFPIDIRIKPGYTAVEEVLNNDPKKMTIHQLHKHRFYLETELFQTGSDTCTICRIVIGSVKITWQISVRDVFQVHTLLLSKKINYNLQNIIHLSISETEMWKGLPILWRGQEVGQIGPIEASGKVRHEPYQLPEQLEWFDVEYDRFLRMYTPIMLLREHTQWSVIHPHNKSVSLLTVKNSFSSMIVLMTCRVPLHLRVAGKLFPLIHLQYAWTVTDTQDYTHLYSLHNTLFKEVMRRGSLNRISQALLINATPQIIKPNVIFTIWSYHFYLKNPPLPYNSPRVAGLRKMVHSDVSKAFTLTNQYVLQFEIGQIFQNEEEFSHYFLCPSMPGYICAYVVEDPVTGNITDIIGFKIATDREKRVAIAIAIISTKTPVRQLIVDLLLFAKQAQVQMFYTGQFGLARDNFASIFDFTLCEWRYWHIYNYRYPEIDEENCCVFTYF